MSSLNDQFVLKKHHLFLLSIIVALVYIFYKINHILLPFYIAIFVTILFGGLVEKCNKKFHIPKALTAGIITILFCIFTVSCFYALFNISFTKATRSITIINNNKDFIANVPAIIEEFLRKFDIESKFNLLAGQFSDLLVKQISSTISRATSYCTSIINITFLFILSPIVMFMMLKDFNLICEKIYLLIPKNLQNETKQIFGEIHESVFKYLEGQTLTAIILSFCYSLILFPIGLNHFIILGILIGFSSFIPYIGFYSAVTTTLFSTYQQFHDLKITIITLVMLLVMQIIDCGFITPKIIGNKLKIHPLFIIFGVLASIPIFGAIGIILALPIVGISGVIAKHMVKKYKNSVYYNGKDNNE